MFNSESILTKTVEQTLGACDSDGLQCEILLINDGSSDRSWQIAKELAENYSNVTAINLLKNYGQHTAILCGINHAKGDFLITMDDDLQNPPSEIIKLCNKINEGYDLVFAKFNSKKHNLYRRLGSSLVTFLNRKIFSCPHNITLTNFRIFSKDVAHRVSAYNAVYPYIPGHLLLSAANIANVATEHHAREIGDSNYSLIRILALLSRLLFNYSSYPLKFLTIVGLIIAFLSFCVGCYYIFHAIFVGSSVPGWTTLTVLLSFLNGLIIFMLGVLGEYVARIVNQVAHTASYHVKEMITPSKSNV